MDVIEKCKYVNREYRVKKSFSINREYFFQPDDTIRIIEIKFNNDYSIYKVRLLRGAEINIQEEQFYELIDFLEA